MSLKQIANKLLRLLPDDGRSVRRIYRRAVDAQRHRVVRRRQQQGNWRLPPPDAVISVDPARIRLHTNRLEHGAERPPLERAFPRDWPGRVEGGDWDVGGIPFEQIEAYVAIRSRIEEGTRWEETGYWRESLRYIEAGNLLWDCRNAEDLARRFEYVDSLIASIRQHGVLPHAQIGAAQDPAGRLTEDIEVNIGRNGEFLFQDGRHRLAIAKVLGLKRVPVRVKVRHEEWQKFREYMFTMVAGGGGAAKDGVLYQSPVHPDLREIPAEHSCEDRLELLLPHLRVHSGRLLDIGCNLGFFCNRFEQVGLECTGIEYALDIAHASNRIALAEGRRYRVIQGDVLDPQVHDPLLRQPFDVVLALNIFHHFIKTRTDYDRLVVLLGKLKPQQIFFEPHRTDEAPMQDAYANLGAEEFVAFVQKHAGLGRVDLVGTAPDGRRIFSLYR
jgi:2-polyprenyl-3-methyl-5-hydroxy-6-metoxy-1,4-benzoquinol methylase